MLAALAAAGRSGPLNYTSDWWTGAVEEDAIRSLPLDGEGGLWSSSFIPPPPRPDFLDDHATPDGLTTCDLCTWAWREKGIFSLDPTQGMYCCRKTYGETSHAKTDGATNLQYC